MSRYAIVPLAAADADLTLATCDARAIPTSVRIGVRIGARVGIVG